jgi:hypothetical protein
MILGAVEIAAISTAPKIMAVEGTSLVQPLCLDRLKVAAYILRPSLNCPGRHDTTVTSKGAVKQRRLKEILQ